MILADPYSLHVQPCVQAAVCDALLSADAPRPSLCVSPPAPTGGGGLGISAIAGIGIGGLSLTAWLFANLCLHGHQRRVPLLGTETGEYNYLAAPVANVDE